MAITVPLDGYCSEADVSALLQPPTTIDGTSVPTITQVTAWITGHYFRINAMLRKKGFIVPVVVIGDQLIVGTQLQLRGSHLVNDDVLKLDDSGGSLGGQVRFGDLFLITGDTQYYVCTSERFVSTSANIIDVEISPFLLRAAADNANVTYTPTDTPEQYLRLLNAHLVAAMVEGKKSRSAEDDTPVNLLQDMADTMWNDLESGKATLVGAPRSKRTTPPGMARLERRG